MRIVITGSSGQIGTNLALTCLGLGHEVVGVDLRANPWTNRFETHRADLTRTMPVLPLAPDVVVHLAAHAKVHELVEHPLKALENVTMTNLALEYCRMAKAAFVFASSREVYGQEHRACTDESQVGLATVCSTYAASKLSGEAMVAAYVRCFGLRALTFRFSNVFGRLDHDLSRMERVVPLFIDRISRGEAVTIFGPGKVLDFTFVDDCVDGLVRGLEALGSGAFDYETINIASGTGHSLVTLVALIGAALDRTPVVRHQPTRPGEIGRYVADLTRARRLLGFEPRFDLERGVKLAVAASVRRRSTA